MFRQMCIGLDFRGKLLAMLLISVCLLPFAHGTEAQMKETLVRVIHQLQAIDPLLQKAANEQPKNPRVKVHFEKFKGTDGAWHNGLRNDLTDIRQSLIAIVNRESIEPREYPAMKDDFVG